MKHTCSTCYNSFELRDEANPDLPIPGWGTFTLCDHCLRLFKQHYKPHVNELRKHALNLLTDFLKHCKSA